MSGPVEVAYELVLGGAAGRVVHVSQVVFAFDVVLVVLHELVFGGQLEEEGEEAEQLDDDFRVAFLMLWDCLLVNGGLCCVLVDKGDRGIESDRK